MKQIILLIVLVGACQKIGNSKISDKYFSKGKYYFEVYQPVLGDTLWQIREVPRHEYNAFQIGQIFTQN